MNIHIPPAALEAGARAEWEAECARIGDYRLPPWEDLNHEVKKLKLENARAAFVAMVENWPGMNEENRNGFSFSPLPHGTAFRYTVIILPLPTEDPDA